MPTGGIEVKADEIKVLNSCSRDLPFHIQDRQKVAVHGIVLSRR